MPIFLPLPFNFECSGPTWWLRLCYVRRVRPHFIPDLHQKGIPAPKSRGKTRLPEHRSLPCPKALNAGNPAFLWGNRERERKTRSRSPLGSPMGSPSGKAEYTRLFTSSSINSSASRGACISSYLNQASTTLPPVRFYVCPSK